MRWPEFITALKEFSLVGWTSYVLIAFGLLSLLAVVGLSAQYFVDKKAEKLTKTHILVADPPVECSIVGGKDRVEFLNGQRKEVVEFGNSHRESAISFYTYFYVTYLIFTIFGLIAAISLAIITKTGINTASPHLIAVFLVCTAIVVLYQGAFGVFQHKGNIESNTKLAIGYAVLLNQIDTYCATGKFNVKDPNDAMSSGLPRPTPTPTNSATNAQVKPSPSPEVGANSSGKIQPFYVVPSGDEFINFVAWQLEHLRSFSIAIDDTKVSAIDNKRFVFP
jgi:NADH:ubiquinone oxidoreductase subunit 3 (subunit A)